MGFGEERPPRRDSVGVSGMGIHCQLFNRFPNALVCDLLC